MDFIHQFREAIRSAGLTPPDEVKPDGELQRFSSSGKRGDRAGWYVLHANGVPAGAFGCWRSQVDEKWHADIGRELTGAEREQHRKRMEAAKAKRELAERELREEARQRAAREWKAATPALDSHPYLMRKGVKAHGLRIETDGRLLVPVRDLAGEWQSLQMIAPDGSKLFLPGGRVSGGYFAIGKPGAVLCIAEGYATAATIHEATDYPVAVAFHAGNLEPVAQALREKLPKVKLIMCADDDAWTDGNPGLSKATSAARAVGGLIAVPDFGSDRPEKTTDFNDLAMHRGLEAVRICIEKARPPDVEPWPELLPLAGQADTLPYPLDALPGVIRSAVDEVASFVQCPVALAACSALSAASVAAQGLVDVRRGPDLIGPASLYVLVAAESGERKSECDRRFSEVLHEWQASQTDRLAPDIARSREDMAAWDQERAALLERIKQASKKGESTHKLREQLGEHALNRPRPVREPRLLLENETAENLAWRLAKPDGWPSAGLLSSEAGVVFGGHAMRQDTIMQSLALLNKLWSGEPYRVGRRTSESFDLVGARLTLGLAVQPETVRQFFEGSRGLVRGTGFAARFLIAWPPSTQGTRLYRGAPNGWKALTSFKARLLILLDTRLTINERGALLPQPLDMDDGAFEAWREFHDDVERELRPGGELAELRDVASKAAENCARLAALFHLLEHGPGGPLAAGHVEAAARIVTWHLSEARRFLGGMVSPPAVANAEKLNGWLIASCRSRGTETVLMREVMNRGPNAVRLKAALLAAIEVLREAGQVRLEGDGRTIRVNPALLQGAS